MYRIEVHEHIGQIISFFMRIGLWHRGKEETVREWIIKFIYSIYYCIFFASLLTGALASDEKDEIIFLTEALIIDSVAILRFLNTIWRKGEVLELLNRVCDHSVEDHGIFTFINGKLKFFIKFSAIFLSETFFCAICIACVIPVLRGDKKLFFNIGFPLDWRNDEFAYWIAFTYIATEMFLTSITWFFTVLIWYLLVNCGLKYVVLGQQFRNMGKMDKMESVEGKPSNRKISKNERDNLYRRDLLECIASHNDLKELTNLLDSFFSKVFAVQLATGALNICCSIYCLSFNRGDNAIELIVNVSILFYNIFDIFVIMYCGNEIKLGSDRLSYALFESDWMDRTEQIKKDVILFGEFLMQPQQLVILKLYPLTLETFSRIMNSAYSMFNLLQNLN